MPRVSPLILVLGMVLMSGWAVWGGACSGAGEPRSSQREAGAPDRASELMEALSGPSASAARAAIAEILEARDERFAAVFIELMRAAQVGLAAPPAYADSVDALGVLTGETFGPDWSEWVRWYAAADLAPPPGFTGWKGRLLAGIDPSFAEFLRDDVPSRIRVEEVIWGGVALDGIPALDGPKLVDAEEAGYLQDDDPVFGIALAGDARAYPLRILDWHEMINDVVGGVPVSLAYCTLCGAGIAYDGRGPDGETYTFGSSGLLMRSNKLMYDRQTRTLWNQFTGEPVLGPLAAGERRLRILPAVVTRWGDWRAQHPETRVLDIDTGHARSYHPGAAYAGYFASPETLFPVVERKDLLPSKARIFGLQVGGIAKAYPLDRLTAEGVVNDEVGGAPVVLVATRGLLEVDGESVRTGPARYRAGAEVRAFGRADWRFSAGGDADTLVDEAGRPWRVTEAALVGKAGERLPRLDGFVSYWFGWNAFHPKTLVWGAGALPLD